MCVNTKEFEKLSEEAKVCEMSVSDYLKTMYIFGKLYVGGNKFNITKEEISLKIWAVKSVFDFFNVDTTKSSEFDFLFKRQKEFERREKKDG